MRVEEIAAHVEVLAEASSPGHILPQPLAHPVAARAGGVLVTNEQTLTVVRQDRKRVRPAAWTCAGQERLEQAESKRCEAKSFQESRAQAYRWTRSRPRVAPRECQSREA